MNLNHYSNHLASRLALLIVFFCSGTFNSIGQRNTEKETKVSIIPRTNPEYTHPNRLWVDLSIGPSLMGFENPELGKSFGANIHYLNPNYRHFQVRYTYSNNDVFILFPTDNTLQETHEFAYMFGGILARKYFLCEVAGGPSVVGGVKQGGENYATASGYASERFVTGGIAFEADMKFMYKRFAGFGIVTKANLNPSASFLTLGFELTLNGPN